MGIVDQPVEDGVGEGGLVDDVVPCLDRKLAGDDRRSCAVAILDGFHQISALSGGQPIRSPVVQDQEIGFDELPEEAREASITVGELQIGDETCDLPEPVREMGAIYLEQIARLTEVIERLADELEAASKTDTQLRRLCTIPGIGPVTAGAVAAFAPDLDTFDSGRNFAAWLGLVPRQRSTGGKSKLGSVSKMGQTDIRRLLIVGAMSVIRWVVRKGGSSNRWLAALVARKPKMVAAVALANKMARTIWALTTKQEDYRMA